MMKTSCNNQSKKQSYSSLMSDFNDALSLNLVSKHDFTRVLTAGTHEFRESKSCCEDLIDSTPQKKR